MAVESQERFDVGVRDAAGRAVPNQRVRIEFSREGADTFETLGTYSTDAAGLATWNFTAQHQAGSYEMRARLLDFPVIQQARHGFSITAGPVRAIDVTSLGSVTAGSIKTISMTALDSAGNVTLGDGASLQLQAPDTQFQFQPGTDPSLIPL